MLPQEFLDRMQRQLADAYPQFLSSFDRPRAVALRFNPLKGKRPELPFVGENVPWEPQGYYYDSTARPGLHPYHEAGVYYLQEASAMSAVALLDPQPGERVCDLCAAPGGKSTQIAARMQGKGLLLCNEINPKRARILSSNIERMGVANALVTNENPETLAKRFTGFFDRVLVDAPCSGEGMFRKEDAALTDWSVETVQMCARRQMQILRSGAAMLKPGGRLVYSTCTFAPEENEQVIEAFLQENPGFQTEDIDAPYFTKGADGTFRLWPHKLLGEGHFAAVLRKTAGEEAEPMPAKAEKIPASFSEFAKPLGIELPQGKAICFGQNLYLAPQQIPELARLRVLRAGLELGECKKDRFEPAHALALWLCNCAVQMDLSAASCEIADYMHGLTISSTKRGWCLVSVDGYSLGWGKADGNVLKNHYPKGLRR